MASLSKTDSRRMYSWWWNSHISPKNSKWLTENLTDVDIKVKAMIKLIEEDGDSFARKAEMYYKKRPELIKLVEELYRAYRSLAERYDHATGALRQAHKTMTEAFPNQVPAGCDDSSPISPYNTDSQTPYSKTNTISVFDPVDFQKNGSTTRKTLNFSDSEDGNDKHRSHGRNVSRFESVGMNENGILFLNESVVKLEDEKEMGLKQYLENLEILSKLESEISNSQEESIKLANRASKAEAESQKLKESLQRLEAENEKSLEKVKESQNVTEVLKQEIKRLKDERDSTYDQYKQSTETKSDFEKKLVESTNEIETLKLAIGKLTKDMQSEIVILKEANGKLEKEVDLRVDQRNALQQEIYCLKKELNELHDDNSNEKTEKTALLEKVKVMGQLLERNTGLGDELEGVKGKLTSLEESYRFLSEEKGNIAVENANLLSRLQVTVDNLSQLSEKNTVLENSLFDANVKLEVLKQKSKRFEDLCQLLADEKSTLITEKGNLVSQMEITEITLKDLELKYSDLEEKYSLMEKERESTLHKVEQLNVSLAQKNDEKNRNMRIQIHNKNKEFEDKLDKSFGIEIEILLKCVQDLQETNEGLRSKVIEGDNTKQMLRILVENLQTVNLVYFEENKSLLQDNVQINDKVRILKDENDVIFHEVLSQSILSKILKSYLEEMRTENLDLKHELQTVISVSDRLNSELVNGNNLLRLKENEYNEAVQQLTSLDNHKTELTETVAGLERENEIVRKLLEDNNRLSNENRILEVKVDQLTTKHEKTEENARLLETEASFYQILLEEKIRELTEVCLNIEEENSFNDLNNELVKELESLRDSIVSLENHTCIGTNEDGEGAESTTMDHDPFTELHHLQSKIKLIELSVVETRMLSMQEKLDVDAKLESATKHIEELIHQNNIQKSNNNPKSTSEISEPDPKDIMLDQASECSSYNVSKRVLTEDEIRETVEDSKAMFKFKHHPEVSRTFNKKKVLERLNSDVQRLTNLQITIDDLKRKVEITLKSRRGKAMIECETLKGQLMEAESAIEKLHELNAKLVKNVEFDYAEFGESESMRRKKVSEQARRVSEKIGRLQLEIQKIQFMLLKLDTENESRGKSRFLDAKKRVLLKDYLYGGGRVKTSIGKPKKNHFCACAEPSTKGD